MQQGIASFSDFERSAQFARVNQVSGCDACGGKGVSGRIGLFEAFEMTDSLAAAISSGITEAKLREEAARQEMVTMRQDGILKALEGIISIEEVLKETAE